VGGKQQNQRAGGGGESPGLRWENMEYGGQLVRASFVSSILAILRARGTQPFPLAHLAAASSSSLPLFRPYPTGRTGKCPIHRSLQELSYSSETLLLSLSASSPLRCWWGCTGCSGLGARRSNLGAWICP